MPGTRTNTKNYINARVCNQDTPRRRTTVDTFLTLPHPSIKNRTFKSEISNDNDDNNNNNDNNATRSNNNRRKREERKESRPRTEHSRDTCNHFVSRSSTLLAENTPPPNCYRTWSPWSFARMRLEEVRSPVICRTLPQVLTSRLHSVPVSQIWNKLWLSVVHPGGLTGTIWCL